MYIQDTTWLYHGNILRDILKTAEARRDVIPLKRKILFGALVGVAAVVAGTVIKTAKDIKDNVDEYDDFDEDFDFDEDLDLDEGQEQTAQASEDVNEEAVPQSDAKASESDSDNGVRNVEIQ